MHPTFIYIRGLDIIPYFSAHRYDNRATDLTKDGMRHGIEGAAAFLIFLSEGTPWI
jgi:hypothetical protein